MYDNGRKRKERNSLPGFLCFKLVVSFVVVRTYLVRKLFGSFWFLITGQAIPLPNILFIQWALFPWTGGIYYCYLFVSAPPLPLI